MKLETLFEGTQWKKLGNHKGMQHRTLTVADQERERAKEAAKKKQTAEDKAAAREAKKNERLLDRLQEPFSYHDFDVNKVLKKFDMVSGMADYDVDDFRKTYRTIEGVKVAALTARVFYSVKLSDMYDQETIEKDFDGRETTEDALYVVFYRSPSNPKNIEVTYTN
jgi:hypothetical protein